MLARHPKHKSKQSKVGLEKRPAFWWDFFNEVTGNLNPQFYIIWYKWSLVEWEGGIETTVSGGGVLEFIFNKITIKLSDTEKEKSENTPVFCQSFKY